jgi:hypothetical protein
VSNEAADAVARAILYEGFSLYPYRPSAHKNRRRVLFGTLVPKAWAEAQGVGEVSEAATEVVLVAEPGAGEDVPTISVSLRFLCLGDEPHEVLIALPRTSLEDLVRGPLAWTFEADGSSGTVMVAAARVRDGVYRVRLVVDNTTALAADVSRDDAERFAMGAAHLVLRAEHARCVSQVDPPASVADVVSGCRQEGLFPVLVGPEGASDTMLASPIILYDHPKVAPESSGDLFDATEIEEILSLRVQTLTDSEKDELRRDPKTRTLLERIEALGPEHLARLHGVFREPGNEQSSGDGPA